MKHKQITIIQNNLNPTNHSRLYIALPIRFGEDSEAIDYCLEKLGITELTDETFGETFEQVREMMCEEFRPAPSRSW